MVKSNTWGIIVIFCLKSCRPMCFILTLSIFISPFELSIIRNKAEANDDLPAPYENDFKN